MSTTVFEHAFYIGNIMSAVLYGIGVIMFSATLRALSIRRNSSLKPATRKFYMGFVIILFMMMTIDVFVNVYWGDQMWIEDRNKPGGVSAFIVNNVSVWYQTLGSTTVIVMIFMGDALLLHRLYIIYGSRLSILILPFLTYLAALSLGIIELVIEAKPNASFSQGGSINFGTPYYSLTISLNMVITGLICFRLRKLGRGIAYALGRENAAMYRSTPSMFIESAAPYSVMGVMFLIPYALGDGTAIAFGLIWGKVTCLSPLLIILRISHGRAWSREAVSRAESSIEIMIREQARATGVAIHTHVATDAASRGRIPLPPSPTAPREKWPLDTSTDGYSSYTHESA